jgi:hypothetical protein
MNGHVRVGKEEESAGWNRLAEDWQVYGQRSVVVGASSSLMVIGRSDSE